MGTLSGVTGDIVADTKTLTVNSVTGLAVGDYITIAGVKRITGITDSVVTIDSDADATVSGAAIAYSPAEFKTFGAISA